MKPHLTLKHLRVHPKDKRTPHDTASVVYQGLPEGVHRRDRQEIRDREKDHRKDVDSVGENKFTRARRKESVEEYNPPTSYV